MSLGAITFFAKCFIWLFGFIALALSENWDDVTKIISEECSRVKLWHDKVSDGYCRWFSFRGKH